VTSILIADADGAVRARLRAALAGMEVHEAAHTGELLAVLRDNTVDAVLVAADLPGGALDALDRITTTNRRIRCVVLTAAPDGGELVAAVLAGAVGYVDRNGSAVERLPAIVAAVLRGEVALPRALEGHLLATLRGRASRRAVVERRAIAPLTEREWAVVELLAEGASTARIAQSLRISDVTVRRHVSGVVGKLGARDRAEVARFLQDR
jgi:DNA-binding NarL/FixJ family response regulator